MSKKQLIKYKKINTDCDIYSLLAFTFPSSSVSPFIVFQINGTKEANDESNPFRFSNIGVETFLNLNSEQNHDDFCLAYVFTDRDFDDGVLGLAWVGSTAGLY